MKRVRIKALPKAQSGLEVRMSQSLNSNANPQWFRSDGVNNQFSQPNIEVNKTLKPVAREGANLEAEKGETAFTDLVGDGIPQLYKIGGERHYDGGTPLNLPEDSFIYSRDKKMKIGGPILESFGKSKDTKDKFTPAELSAKYDINEYRKMLADPDSDKLQRDTAELMIANYNLKLGKLGLVQESKKGFPDGIPAISMPYIETMQVDSNQFFQNPQGQGPQGMPDQPAADNVARYGKTLPKHQTKGVVAPGTDKWLSYSGKNDPASGYWDRVRGAGLFQRSGDDVVDPRMDKAFEKLYNPDGVMDWVGNLFSMPQKEMNNLLTGYYETPMETASRYHDISPAVKFIGDVATDPFFWQAELQAGAKLAAPYVTKGAEILGTGTKKLAIATGKGITKLAEKAAPLIVKGYQKVKPVVKATLKKGDKLLVATGHIGKPEPESVEDFVSKETQKGQIAAKQKEHIENNTTPITTPAVPISTVSPYRTTTGGGQTYYWKGNTPIKEGEYTNAKSREQQTIQAPVPAEFQSAVPTPIATPTKALTPEQEYEEYMKANAPKKNFGGDIKKFDGGGSYTISKNNRWITFEDGSVFDRNTGGFIKPANPNWDKSTAPATTKTSAKAPSKTNPMMGTYTPSVMEALKKKEAEGYEIFAPKIKPGEKGHTGKERDVLQHQQKKVHNVYGDVEWSPEQQEDFKSRHGWVYEQKPDFNPTDETVVGAWPKGTIRNGKDVSGQPMTKGQQDTQWFQQEAEKAVPGYFNQGVSGTEFDALMGEHTFSVPGWKKKAAPAPGPAKIDEEEERIKQAVLGPEYKTPGPEWWLQDKVKMAGAFGDLMRVKKYNPWEATAATAYGERTFYDPTRELAANAEMVNQGIQGASTYSGPQGFAATAAALQGQGSATDANTMARYNNMNVEASNQLSDMNTDIFNRSAQNRATQATRLFDKQTIANQQFDNSKNMARQNLRQGFIDAITNRANTYNLNTMNPQFAVGPGNGGMIYNIPGSNRGTDPTSLAANAKAQQKSAKEFMDSLHGQGYTEKEMELLFNQAFPKAQSRENQQGPQGYT